MAYSSFDPRKSIRAQIGTSVYDVKERKDNYCIEVTDDRGNTVKIPMYISEDMTSDFIPEMPYIEILLVETTYEEHNPSATIREMRCYFQFNIYFTRTDNITPSDFLKEIKDAFQNTMRTNQESTSGVWYMSIKKERPQIIEGGKGLDIVCILEAYAIYTDRE